jgi:hypothetical protein
MAVPNQAFGLHSNFISLIVIVPNKTLDEQKLHEISRKVSDKSLGKHF